MLRLRVLEAERGHSQEGCKGGQTNNAQGGGAVHEDPHLEPSTSGLEQSGVTRNLLLEVIAKLGGGEEEVSFGLSAVRRVLVGKDQQADVTASGISEGHHHHELLDEVLLVPPGISNRHSLGDHVDVVRII